jgi:hypothetical protein
VGTEPVIEVYAFNGNLAYRLLETPNGGGVAQSVTDGPYGLRGGSSERLVYATIANTKYWFGTVRAAALQHGGRAVEYDGPYRSAWLPQWYLPVDIYFYYLIDNPPPPRPAVGYENEYRRPVTYPNAMALYDRIGWNAVDPDTGENRLKTVHLNAPYNFQYSLVQRVVRHVYLSSHSGELYKVGRPKLALDMRTMKELSETEAVAAMNTLVSDADRADADKQILPANGILRASITEQGGRVVIKIKDDTRRPEVEFDLTDLKGVSDSPLYALVTGAPGAGQSTHDGSVSFSRYTTAGSLERRLVVSLTTVSGRPSVKFPILDQTLPERTAYYEPPQPRQM